MDRNLGATSVEPGSAESMGLLYQWGRKDPFIVPGFMYTAPYGAITYEYYDSVETAISHPTVVFCDAIWNGVDNLWGVHKTKYDPCPSGWRVSDKEIWPGLRRSPDAYNGYFQVAHEDASPTVYIPLPGYSNGSEWVDYNGSAGYLWTNSRGVYAEVYWDYSEIYLNTRGVDSMLGVRCMKESHSTPGSNEGYKENEDYEW